MGKYDVKSALKAKDKLEQIDQETAPSAVLLKTTMQPRKEAEPAGKRPAYIRGQGKRSNADYERLCVYIRSDTRKNALRKWEDAGGGDASELVQKLMAQYLES